jgi:predicted DNA-binding transcriptional regulator AlpA
MRISKELREQCYARKWEQLPQLLDIDEVAHMLFVRPMDVKDLVAKGGFPPALNLAGRQRWTRGDVDAFIRHRVTVRFGGTDFDPGKHALTPKELVRPDIPEELADVAEKITAYTAIPSCVYFLVNFGTVVYVGKSTNLALRLHVHRRGTKAEPAKEFNRVLYLPVEPSMLDAAELYYIRLFEPKHNKAGIEKE